MKNSPQDLSYEELWVLTQRLQAQVERGVKRHQELISVRNELDDELERFRKLNEFNRKALQIDTPSQLIDLALEGYAAIFQLPRVCIYRYIPNQAEAILMAQLGSSAKEINEKLSFRLAEGSTTFLHPNDTDFPVFKLTHLKEAIVSIYQPSSSAVHLFPLIILAGFAEADTHFMQPINKHLLPAFANMTHELGLRFEQQTILKRLKSEIEGRMAYQHLLEEAKAELENRVTERTRDLATSNQLLHREIIEKQSIESELLRSNADLEQFAYIASHDLKTPLRSIGGFAQLLSRRYKERLDRQGKEYLEFIFHNVEQLNNLINDLLLYSRIDSFSNEAKVIDLNQLLAEIKKELHGSIEEHQAQLIFQDLPIITGIEVQLKHLFRNLIDNAIKFRKPDLSPIVEINVSHIGEKFYHFRVRDNGIGIDAQYKTKVFEAFQRLHSSDQYHGTGLGLSICQKIVQKSQGEIWFEPRKNKQGTDFHFTLPTT